MKFPSYIWSIFAQWKSYLPFSYFGWPQGLHQCSTYKPDKFFLETLKKNEYRFKSIFHKIVAQSFWTISYRLQIFSFLHQYVNIRHLWFLGYSFDFLWSIEYGIKLVLILDLKKCCTLSFSFTEFCHNCLLDNNKYIA